MFDAERIKNECVEWIRGFFEENGRGCNAVVGISGGKDSSVAADVPVVTVPEAAARVKFAPS